MTATIEKSVDLSKAILALRIAHRELMIAVVRPMLDKEQTTEIATRLGEVSSTLNKLEAMK